jgi:hypothetical protein
VDRRTSVAECNDDGGPVSGSRPGHGSRHEIAGQPGKVAAVVGFLNRGRMGRFDDAIAFAAQNGTTLNRSWKPVTACLSAHGGS